ncbi:MAG: hypothetical protein D6732_23825 [Methanobacteriota archaeon]|nr:MAG: hypothetical protein D6732_23825 [Euryarchaeota archaeon]
MFGYISVWITVFLIPIFIIAVIKFFSRKRLDIQYALLLLSTIFIFPVFVYESILFVHLFQFPLPLQFSPSLLKLCFGLGLIGIVFYNLQFMLMKDFPTFPIGLIAIWTGIAIGGMMVALRLNPADPVRPIFYDPLTGGLEFVIGMVAFNLIGYYILIASTIQQKRKMELRLPHLLTILGIAIYFTAPFVVVVQRILQLVLQPFNLLLFPYELGLFLHLISQVLFDEKAFFSTELSLRSISIIEVESQTVIAGYSHTKEDSWTKLSSMVVMATDSILKEIMSMTLPSEIGKYRMTYGDTIFLKNEKHIIFALFGEAGNKIGKFLTGRMLQNGKISHLTNEEELRTLILQTYYPFFQNRNKPDSSQFFFQKSLK